MIKMIIGMLLITFDYVISPDGMIKLDLLPDFIGYGILVYGFYRIGKNADVHGEYSGSKKVPAKENSGRAGGKSGSRGNSKKVVVSKSYKTNKAKANKTIISSRNISSKIAQRNHENMVNAIRYGIVAAIVMFVVSYAAYMLDMYGYLQRMPEAASVCISIFKDMGMLLVMVLYIQVLTALQGQNSNFQVKRMTLIWKIAALCVICEYISMTIESAMLTFIIFEKVADVMFMVYMLVSDRTYKTKFIGKTSKY